MDRLHVWWDLPGPASVIGKIVQSVENRERVLCLAAPDPRPSGLTGAIGRKLRGELSLECATLDVSREDQTQPIPHLLAGALGISAVEIGSVGEFASHPSLADQVLVVDGIGRDSLRRWGLFLRQLHLSRSEEIVVGPILIVLLPAGLTREETTVLRGSARSLTTQGAVGRYDAISYAAQIGTRPSADLASRVGHATTIEVAAWSREVLERMLAWEVSDQIDPLPLLERAAVASEVRFPCWENGLVDYWEDEPAAHAIGAIKYGMHEHLRRRMWSAQAGVLLPFAYRILRSLIGRHKEYLAKLVSPEKPWMKKYGSREVAVTDYRKLEFYDLQQLADGVMSPEERELRRVAQFMRNKVAHPDLLNPDQISKISDYYEAHRDLIEGDVPGWNWPRCGQTMILTVGPSGGGKSTWSSEQGVEIVSSDEIRREISADGETPGSQAGIFHRVRIASSKIMEDGRDVIVDAMHIEAEHRLRQISIAPADMGIKYVIIDRPLSEKLRDAGWRSGRGIIEKYHELFPDKVAAALNGDDRPGVDVLDLRTQGAVDPAAT
ncbi:AAA family ATPase [Bradyrhizobium sp. 1(2017)]|uniref:AAA family ATPase n=1 Tax=Bradyrhizobium sp. 1(2017) TaxID=1404888 RepID=UPI00140F31F6|nr:AAA family ATPase [Bradyrhizobium sp. 1(2017)]QIO36947.1 ATP-binding protein [Bradyrhizobium sp. 1(2017)]